MDEFAAGSLLLAFSGAATRCSSAPPPAAGPISTSRRTPGHTRRRCSKAEWESKARAQGMIAVNSILRIWVRGQITAIETGITEFRHVSCRTW